MSEKKLKDVINSLPITSDLISKSILVSDTDGMQYRANNSAFACCVKGSFSVGTVLRIKNLTSVLISARGSNGGRAAFVWVSSYANGTIARTSYLRFFLADNYYQFYVNGESEGSASIYVRLTGSSGIESFSIVSLAGEIPTVETVSSVPSDTTRILLYS